MAYDRAMQTKAAILWEVNKPWAVEDIELDDPKEGEVMVKLAASGLCHSDEHLVPAIYRSSCRSSVATRAPASSPKLAPESAGSKKATTSCSASSHLAAVARAVRPVTKTSVTWARSWLPVSRHPT